MSKKKESPPAEPEKKKPAGAESSKETTTKKTQEQIITEIGRQITELETRIAGIAKTELADIKKQLEKDLAKLKAEMPKKSSAEFATKVRQINEKIKKMVVEINKITGKKEKKESSAEKKETRELLVKAVEDGLKMAIKNKKELKSEKEQKELRWVISAVGSALNQDGEVVARNGGNEQREGIPVDRLINILKKIAAKITDVEQKKKCQEIVDILDKSGHVKKYSEAHKYEHWRTEMEAKLISNDYRGEETGGDPDKNYQLAMAEMENRRELILPETEATDPEEIGEDEEDIDGGVEEPVEPDEPEEPEDPEVVAEGAERAKKIIDIPMLLIKEILTSSEMGRDLVEAIANKEKTLAVNLANILFDNLPDETWIKLDNVLSEYDLTVEEFITMWKSDEHIAKGVIESIECKVEQVVKKRAAEAMTLMDKVKGSNWPSALKRTLMVAGGAAAIGTLASVTFGLGAIVAVGAGISGGGLLGRFLSRNKKIKEGEKAGEDAAKIRMDNELKAKEKQESDSIIDEIMADGDNYISNTLSQTIREVTSGNAENVNGLVLREKVKLLIAEQLEINGETVETAKISALVDALAEKRTTLQEEAKKKNSDGIIIQAIENLMKAKSGNLFAEADKDSLRNVLGYAAPVAVGGAVMAAGYMGGGVVFEGVRAGLAGAAMGYAGYRLGKSMDQEAQRKEVTKQVKIIVDEVQALIEYHHHGAQMGDATDELAEKISTLEGHLKVGTLDSDAMLKTRAEGLLREGQRALIDQRDITDRAGLQSLVDGLTRHRDQGVKQAEADLKKILKKTSNWRRYVFGAGGFLVGVASVIGIAEWRQPGGSKILGAITDRHPAGVVPPVDVGGRGGNQPPHPETPKAPQVQDSYIIKKGEGILRGAYSFEKHHPDQFTHSDGSKWSADELHKWRVDELKSMGFKFRHGEWGYPNTVHPGAKIDLITDSDGRPHLHLIEDSHVTKHDIHWRSTEPAIVDNTSDHDSPVYIEDHPQGVVQPDQMVEPTPDSRFAPATPQEYSDFSNEALNFRAEQQHFHDLAYHGDKHGVIAPLAKDIPAGATSKEITPSTHPDEVSGAPKVYKELIDEPGMTEAARHARQPFIVPEGYKHHDLAVQQNQIFGQRLNAIKDMREIYSSRADMPGIDSRQAALYKQYDHRLGIEQHRLESDIAKFKYAITHDEPKVRFEKLQGKTTLQDIYKSQVSKTQSIIDGTAHDIKRDQMTSKFIPKSDEPPKQSGQSVRVKTTTYESGSAPKTSEQTLNQ